MGGHICVDACQGGLASVLPFLVIQSGFSYTEITALVLASNSASAIIQPLFGWLGDKKARPWLMAVGVALAGIGLALVGVLQSYWLVVAAAMISGIGNAMLHPEGARAWRTLPAVTIRRPACRCFPWAGRSAFAWGR